jgi:hypothetical protein
MESQPNLTGLRAPQCEVDHIAARSEQQNYQRSQSEAADENRPIPRVETEKSTIGRNPQVHVL